MGCAKPLAEYRDLTLTLFEGAVKLLEAAGKRRKKKAHEMAADIIVGVLTRGSIDRLPDIARAVEMAESYEKAQDRGSSERKLGAGIKPNGNALSA